MVIEASKANNSDNDNVQLKQCNPSNPELPQFLGSSATFENARFNSKSFHAVSLPLSGREVDSAVRHGVVLSFPFRTFVPISRLQEVVEDKIGNILT